MPSLRGAAPALVRSALETGEPLPGTAGFAGEVDGRLVRDALGREPLYVERAALPLEPDPVSPAVAPAATSDEGAPDVEPSDWAFDPSELAEPEPLPAGHVLDERGLARRWSLPDSSGAGADAAERSVALGDLSDAVDAALADLDAATPVAFSGGVDSGIVASATDGPLYVAGFPDSQDVEAATEAAAAMGRELRVVEIDHDDLERAVRAVADATGRTNAMDVAIAVPLFLVAERVAADGSDRLALGQGADELFGGYAKVAKAPEDDRLDADVVLGARDEVLASLPEQLPRDVLAVRAGGVEPVLPLLHDGVVEAALELPPSLLVDGERRKVALREVAAERLPASVAERDKKALQYGSLVARELDRLARQAGFKRRMDDHVSRYVGRLVEGSLERGSAERQRDDGG